MTDTPSPSQAVSDAELLEWLDRLHMVWAQSIGTADHEEVAAHYKAAAARLSQLTAENAAMRKALEPFAEYVECVPETYADEDNISARFPAGVYRRARAALNSAPPPAREREKAMEEWLASLRRVKVQLNIQGPPPAIQLRFGAGTLDDEIAKVEAALRKTDP